MENIYKGLAHKIKDLREKKGLKGKDIAEAVNIHPTVYSKFEKHGQKLPLERIEQILNVLGYEFDITEKKTLLILT